MNIAAAFSETEEFKSYQISWVVNQSTPALRASLIQFWLANGAIADPHEAWRRSFEVAGVARDHSGNIVGVSSVYIDRLPSDGLPYWFYRTFIRPDCRIMGLAPRLFQTTYNGLSRLYRAEPYAPSGIIVILENSKLEGVAGSRIIQRCGLERLDLVLQGRSVWRRLL